MVSQLFQLAGRRIYVAGHTGMAGRALVRRLKSEECEILTIASRDLDLRRQEPTELWLARQQPDVVIVAAAHVGGILANSSYPVDFLADNLAIELNLVRASHNARVKKLLFLGSTCIYPKFAPQPMTEDALLTGQLEPTNQWYAIAKIAGVKLCQAYRRQFGADFIAVMPTNLYGPGDNYHPENSHVVAALIRRFHEAKVAKASNVIVWGTGTPRREFLNVDDFADACVHLLKTYSGEDFVNIGVGEDVSIDTFARIVAEIVGYRGNIAYDRSRPDGTPRKLVDVSRLTALGWRARTPLREGLELAYADFLKTHTREKEVTA
jgi:GDP-L-fucose synthase